VYFPPEAVGNRNGFEYDYRSDDSYYPRSAAAQLGISVSFFRESENKDRKAPVIMGRGMIACNKAALQEWWDRKKHHSQNVRGPNGP